MSRTLTRHIPNPTASAHRHLRVVIIYHVLHVAALNNALTNSSSSSSQKDLAIPRRDKNTHTTKHLECCCCPGNFATEYRFLGWATTGWA